ncbi:hypothetical protein [Dactylosporangium sp. NPDC051484]|uniref:hypothetical protein n=1 Tax=Dactylosporangium sp. NPDC051484 TaxID=3154942 RepID=UPI00344F8E47
MSDWIAGQSFNLIHRRWLTDGRSGSYVALVVVHPPRGMLTGAVLKLLPPDLARREGRASSLAWQLSPPEFAEAHLVRTMPSAPVEGPSRWWVQLQEVGQPDRAESQTLAQLQGHMSFGAYCATVIEAIAKNWNWGTADPEPMNVDAGQFLREDLGARLADVRAFAETAGLGDGSVSEFRLAHRREVLPNPVALLNREADPSLRVLVFLGNGHGDLHPGNVLVPVDAGVVRADLFRLIDYGRFSSGMPVSRDPVKLALAGVASRVDFCADPVLNAVFADAMVTPAAHPPRTESAWHHDVAARIHHAAEGWARRRHVVADWTRQHRLTLLASALRTVGRAELSHAERLWHLEVAALALRELKADRPAAIGTRLATNAPTEASASERPRSYLPAVKRAFCRRLGDSWAELADELGVPAHQQARFQRGGEARAVWEWAEVRERLSELPDLLRIIDREDLTQMFGADAGR